MRRFVPAMLVVLTMLVGCAPAERADVELTATAPSPRAVAVATAQASAPAGPVERPAAPEPTAAPSRAPGTAAPATSPTPSPDRQPPPEPEPSTRPDADRADRPYEINLASTADFVPQYTFEWCVGASLQMARSIIADNRNTSRASQRRLWELARTLTVRSPYGGANPAGWTAALNELGLGPYRLVSVPTFHEAVDRAARALRGTGRPVGLVMWAGRHAWVMTGFRATADPRGNPDSRVTRVRVMDPLYPHGSRWGRSPAPNQLVRLKSLSRQFVRRDRPEYDFGVDPGWLLVLPTK